MQSPRQYFLDQIKPFLLRPQACCTFRSRRGAVICPRSSEVEHFLGKEEVTGSSPVVGSIALPKNKIRAAFLAAVRFTPGGVSRFGLHKE